MKITKFPLFVQLILAIALVIGLQFVLFYFFQFNTNSFYYQPVHHVVFLSIASAILLFTHQYIAKKNSEQLGYAFLGTMTLKVVASFLFIQPVLDLKIQNEHERTVFFILFLLFLALDVWFTTQILNAKNKSSKKM